MLLAFMLRACQRAGGFGFGVAFPLGDLGVWGDGAVILGDIAACGVGVEATGIHGGIGVDIACAWES